MKKIIFLSALIFSASVCFAQMFSGSTIEYMFGVDSYVINDNDAHEYYYGYSFGFAGRTMFNESPRAGLGYHANFMYYPQLIYVDENIAMIIKNNVFDFFFTFDFLFGPVFLLHDTHRLKMPLTLGIRGRGMSGEISEQGVGIETTNYYTYGVGFSLSGEIYLHPRFFIVGKVQGGFDFVFLSNAEFRATNPGYVSYNYTERDAGFTRAFSFNPQIGLGFRF